MVYSSFDRDWEPPLSRGRRTCCEALSFRRMATSWRRCGVRPRSSPMVRLGLAGRLYLIIGLGFTLSLLIVAFLLQRIGMIQGTYETVLTTQVRQLDQARLLEVSLRWQVQEWKDI